MKALSVVKNINSMEKLSLYTKYSDLLVALRGQDE
jgi:hypothetical protein